MCDDDSVTHEPAQWGKKVLNCDKSHDQSKSCSQMTHASKCFYASSPRDNKRRLFCLEKRETNISSWISAQLLLWIGWPINIVIVIIIIIRAAQLVAAWQPGCEKMKREWKNGERMRKSTWRGNGGRMGKWREIHSFSSLSIHSYIKSCLILSQMTFVANVSKNLRGMRK